MAERIEIKGLREVQREQERIVKELSGTPMLEAMRKATLTVERAAKQNAPVDTGRLRASITPEVVQGANSVQGTVGSNVVYAPYVELGTRPHFPPLAALETWARRHGTTAWLVAIGIARKGTKARKFLESALTENADKVFRIIEDAVAKILKG